MPTFPQITSPPQASAEVLINAALVALQHQAAYANAYATTTGLTWGYYGGMWGGFTVTAGTFTLTNNADNYIVVAVATGTSTCSTSVTNWNDVLNYVKVYKVTTLSGVVSATEDHRGGPGGVHGGTGTGVGGGGGSASGLAFIASTTTTDSDPGTGTLRWNNATQSSATILYIDNTDSDSTSLALLWAALQIGTFITITKAADSNVWQLWKVTAAPVNGTGYYKFTVTLEVQEGGNISNGTQILLAIDAAGASLANNSVTYAIMQDVSATSRAIGRNTAGAGDPEEVTLTQMLDWIGSAAQGDILYRNATVWARRAAGTAKFMLQTQGASADPTWVAPRQVIPIACSDETTALIAGTSVVTFRMPYAFKVLEVRASVTTAPTGSGNLTIDINESGTTIISTKLTFDASEKTTVTAATPAVISDADLADDAEMSIDIDAVSGTVTGAGLKVYLIGYPVT